MPESGTTRNPDSLAGEKAISGCCSTASGVLQLNPFPDPSSERQSPASCASSHLPVHQSVLLLRTCRLYTQSCSCLGLFCSLLTLSAVLSFCLLRRVVSLTDTHVTLCSPVLSEEGIGRQMEKRERECMECLFLFCLMQTIVCHPFFSR